ncbi:unnamed protein product [Parajaminaea phylloscopi]
MMLFASAPAPRGGPQQPLVSDLHPAQTSAHASTATAPDGTTLPRTVTSSGPSPSSSSSSSSSVFANKGTTLQRPSNAPSRRSTLPPIRQGAALVASSVGGEHAASPSPSPPPSYLTKRSKTAPVRPLPPSRHQHHRPRSRPDGLSSGTQSPIPPTMSPTALLPSGSSDHLSVGPTDVAAPASYYNQDSVGRSSSAAQEPSGVTLGEFGLVDAHHHTHPSRSQTFGSEYDFNGSEAGGAPPTSGEGRRVRRRKRPAPPELLIIVRPPPSSKDRNPLNLQIQLVVPQAPAAAAARTSGETSRDASGLVVGQPSTPGSSSSGVVRRPSVSSTRSGRSEASSSAVSSIGGGGGGGVKRVTPLYNLSFHSILPTTISDAGTDERVAKYSRKGVDIDGFGTLEPTELIRGLNDAAALAHNPSASPNLGILSDEVTSDSGEQPTRAHTEPPTSFDSMTPEAQSPDPGRFGARFARKLKGLSLNGSKAGPAASAVSVAGVEASNVSASPSFSSFFSGLGGGARTTRPLSTAGDSVGPRRPASSAGIAPTFLAHHPPQSRSAVGGSDVAQLAAGAGLGESGTRRTQGYFWTVKKYNRKVSGAPEIRRPETTLGPDGQNAVLANVWRRFNTVNVAGGHELHPPPSEIPLRVEWTRERRSQGGSGMRSPDGAPRVGEGMSEVASKRASTSSTGLGISNNGAANGTATEAPTSADSGAAVAAAASARLRPPVDRRPSATGLAARSSGRLGGATRSQGGSARGSMDQQSTRDSDATSDAGITSGCGGDSGYDSDPEDSETPWSCHLVLGPSTRVPIGTLSPAPHHPKIVAQLAVPFPLPDLSQTGLGADGAGLTREEIKDIICVTCLHLIIRESFGGLGRVKRRGDRV